MKSLVSLLILGLAFRGQIVGAVPSSEPGPPVVVYSPQDFRALNLKISGWIDKLNNVKAIEDALTLSARAAAERYRRYPAKAQILDHFAGRTRRISKSIGPLVEDLQNALECLGGISPGSGGNYAVPVSCYPGATLNHNISSLVADVKAAYGYIAAHVRQLENGLPACPKPDMACREDMAAVAEDLESRQHDAYLILTDGQELPEEPDGEEPGEPEPEPSCPPHDDQHPCPPPT